MSTTVEEQARRLLWLFPRWMRADRGEEAVGLVLDLVPADAEHLPRRSRWDLIRAGLHARRRGTPPLRVLHKVSTAGMSRVDPVVPSEWRPWLIDRLQASGFVWTGFLLQALRMVPLVVYAGFNASVTSEYGPSATDWLTMVAAFTLIPMVFWLAFRRNVWRRRLAAANGIAADGRPLPPHEVVTEWHKGRIPNFWATGALAAFVLVGLAYSPIVWASTAEGGDPPATGRLDGVVSALAIAAVAGTAWWFRWRLQKVDPAAPASTQPPLVPPWSNLVIPAVIGGLVAAAWSWSIAIAGYNHGLPPLSWLIGPAAGVAAGVRCVVVERRIGRRVGIWDLSPSWAPQLVVRTRPDEARQRPSDPPSPTFS